MSTTTLENKVGRKIGTLLLAGALATGGVAVAQVSAAPVAEAAVCGGWTSQWDGHARALNTCGYGYAKVGRLVGVSAYVKHDTKYRELASVTFTSGKRYFEATHRW